MKMNIMKKVGPCIALLASIALLLGIQNNAIAQGMPGQQSYKVKRAENGRLDPDSQLNFESLSEIAGDNGTVLVWVATNASYDSDIPRDSTRFMEQQKASVKYSSRILEELKVKSDDAIFMNNGPYFAFDATEKHLKRLLRMKTIKGYWGIVGAGSVKEQEQEQ
jgi:hypothetical protein